MGANAPSLEWKEDILNAAGDRFERRLAIELSELQIQLRATMHADLTHVRQELAATRVEMLKWSFVFWISQVAAMAGLLALMLRGH